MLLKDGTSMPKILYEVLERDSHAMVVFMKMSESYQQLCVKQLIEHSSNKTMRERMNDVIQSIYRYGETHDL